MPSMEQFIQIYELSDAGKSDIEIESAIDLGLSTIERAQKLRREIENGLDIDRLESASIWKRPTIEKALAAIEFLDTERAEGSNRREIACSVASELSKTLSVPLSGEILEPNCSKWPGPGLAGLIEQEPELVFGTTRERRIFDKTMSTSTRKLFSDFRSAMRSFGRSIKTIHRKLSAELPRELSDPGVVRYPQFAKEAAVVSMLYSLARSNEGSEAYYEFIGREGLVAAEGVTTIRLGGWAFDMSGHGAIGESAGRELVSKLLEHAEIVFKSIEGGKFKDSYNDANKAAKILRDNLSQMSE